MVDSGLATPAGSRLFGRQRCDTRHGRRAAGAGEAGGHPTDGQCGHAVDTGARLGEAEHPRGEYGSGTGVRAVRRECGGHPSTGRGAGRPSGGGCSHRLCAIGEYAHPVLLLRQDPQAGVHLLYECGIAEGVRSGGFPVGTGGERHHPV